MEDNKQISHANEGRKMAMHSPLSSSRETAEWSDLFAVIYFGQDTATSGTYSAIGNMAPRGGLVFKNIYTVYFPENVTPEQDPLLLLFFRHH